MKRTLLLLLALLPSATQAQLNYTTNDLDNTIVVMGYTGGRDAVVVPDTFNGLPVTWIYDFAFSGSSVTSVSLGTNVAKIANSAFANCPYLTTMTVPASVTSIGTSAFDSGGSLTNITVAPNNPAFSSLNGVLFDKGQSTLVRCPMGRAGDYTVPNTVTCITNGAFNSSQSLTRITIPSAVTNIGASAFAYCSSLVNVFCQGNAPTAASSGTSAAFYNSRAIVYFLDGTTGWGYYMGGAAAVPFDPQAIGYVYRTNGAAMTISWYNGDMDDAVIPATIRGLPVTTIQGLAFSGIQMRRILIPATVTTIRQGAFVQDYGLQAVYFLGNYPYMEQGAFSYGGSPPVTYHAVGTAGWPALPYLPGTTSPLAPWDPQLPFTATTNGGAITLSAYIGFGGSVNFPSSINGLPVTGIGASTFTKWGHSVTNVTLPNGLQSIGDYAFYGCMVSNIDIPGSVTEIGSGAFAACPLTSVILPNALTNISDQTFNYCRYLRSVSIPAGVTSIGSYAFANCDSLTDITLPSGLTSISDYCFNYCTALRSINIPEGVTNIGTWAFMGCPSLASITLPASVGNIGDYAFYGCTGLGSIYFNGSLPSLGTSVFDQDTATVHYWLGTAGWENGLGNLPVVASNARIRTDGAGFGIQANHFGFDITGDANQVVAVEVCTNLGSKQWARAGTNVLTGGPSHFSDGQSSNYPARFYRLRFP